LVAVFREVRRVLRDDGTLWLNLGDSYAGSWGAQGREGSETRQIAAHPHRASGTGSASRFDGLRPKNRLMIPARVALALQSDGWWLRDEIVWHKPRTTPHPVKDRTVAAHEMVYLLSKRERYFFDYLAIEEPSAYPGVTRQKGKAFRLQGAAKAAALATMDKQNAYGGKGGETMTVRDTRRARSVWSISPQPYRDAHFATMPPALAEKCVIAGSRPGDVVLDPFGGAGTTGLVALKNGRSAVLVELNPAYAALARRRCEAHDPRALALSLL
jgi:DNA modification methylase